VDWHSGSEVRDDGVMLSRKASAPGPEKWCWTLKRVLAHVVPAAFVDALHVPDIE
jgi:hypothetical protein